MNKIENLITEPLSLEEIISISTNEEATIEEIKNFHFKDNFSYIEKKLLIAKEDLLENDEETILEFISYLITGTLDLEDVSWDLEEIIDGKILISISGDPTNIINKAI